MQMFQKKQSTRKLPTVELLHELQQKEYEHQSWSTKRHLKLCQSVVNRGWRIKPGHWPPCQKWCHNTLGRDFTHPWR